jgi:hypothetical protein
MTGNPLVAPVAAGKIDWFTGMGVVDNFGSVAKAIDERAWAEGLANVGVGGLGMLGAVADPLATAIAAGVGWVLEHCHQLREALDALAGNPDVIASFAATWTNVSGALQEAADELRSIVVKDTANWVSPAIEAYRGVAFAEAETLAAVGAAAAGVGSAVTMGGVVVATVRATVRDLVAEAIGHIISKALQALTVVLIPKVVPEVIALVAKWSARIAGWLRKLVRVISRLAELCAKLKPVFEGADKVDDFLQKGYDGMLARAPGLRAAGLDPAIVRVPHGKPPTMYPRVTLANNAVTESAKRMSGTEQPPE